MSSLTIVSAMIAFASGAFALYVYFTTKHDKAHHKLNPQTIL